MVHERCAPPWRVVDNEAATGARIGRPGSRTLRGTARCVSKGKSAHELVDEEGEAAAGSRLGRRQTLGGTVRCTSEGRGARQTPDPTRKR
jgi:hypothetical protein